MSVQLENGYIRIANEIWDEIIRRDFTKRQKDILMFVWRLSYGCRRKAAHVPLLKDFSMCGVTQNHIKDELIQLTRMKVIDWDREEMIFAFNKNYEVWQVTPVRWWDDERFKSLLHLNITSQNGNFPKQELPEKGSMDFPKREIEQPVIPCGSKDEGLSKDSSKDITTTTTTDDYETVYDTYRKVFGTHSMIPLISDYVTGLKNKGYTDRFVIELMLETGESGSKPSLRLMQAICDRWIKDGIYTRVEAKRRKGLQLVSGGQATRKPYQSRQEIQNEKLMREIKEEEERERERGQENIFDNQQHISELPYR